MVPKKKQNQNQMRKMRKMRMKMGPEKRWKKRMKEVRKMKTKLKIKIKRRFQRDLPSSWAGKVMKRTTLKKMKMMRHIFEGKHFLEISEELFFNMIFETSKL